MSSHRLGRFMAVNKMVDCTGPFVARKGRLRCRPYATPQTDDADSTRPGSAVRACVLRLKLPQPHSRTVVRRKAAEPYPARRGASRRTVGAGSIFEGGSGFGTPARCATASREAADRGRRFPLTLGRKNRAGQGTPFI